MITDTLCTTASADDLWRLTLDVERWPELSPTMTSVEKLDPGPMHVGSRARVRQPGQPARVWTVTELDETRHRFVWSTTGPGMTMTGGHEIASDADGLVNRLTLESTGPLGRIAGVLLAPVLRRAIAQENAGFVRAAEGAAAQED